MPLDPQVQDVLDAMIALGAPPLNTLPVADARAAFIALGAARGGDPGPYLHARGAWTIPRARLLSWRWLGDWQY